MQSLMQSLHLYVVSFTVAFFHCACGEEGVDCEPGLVTIRVKASSSQPVYVEAGSSPLVVQKKSGGSWKDLTLSVGCLTSCDRCVPISCIHCPEAILALEPGEEKRFEWDGYYFSKSTCFNPKYFMLTCAEQKKATVGRYRIGVCYATEYESTGPAENGCYDVEEGYINNATIEGEKTCVWEEFEYSVCEPVEVEVEIKH